MDCLDSKKFEYPELLKFNGKLYTLYVRIFWIYRKSKLCSYVQCMELCKFIWKLCTLYVRNVWIWRKIKYPKLRKFNEKLRTDVRIFWICRKIEHLEMHNSTRNCAHYLYGLSGFAEKLNIQNCVSSTGNCVHFMYGMSGFAEKLNIQNCVNSTGNCVHYICKMT